MASKRVHYVCVILLLLPLTSMASLVDLPSHQSMTKDNNIPHTVRHRNQYRNTDKLERQPVFKTLSAKHLKHDDNTMTELPRQPKTKMICNEDKAANGCHPKSTTNSITWPATINYTTNQGLLRPTVSKRTLRKVSRQKRQLRNLFQFTEGSPKPRRQPRITGNGRMFQMQEFYNMLKASQRKQQQQQQQIHKQLKAEAQQSEEGTTSEPQYLPRFAIDPTSDLIYASQLGLRRRNLEHRGSRAIHQVRDQHLKNGTVLSEEEKRNIFLSKGWGASGSLEMSVSRASPSMSHGVSDTTPYAFTSKHWGPLGKREEKKKENIQSQWTPFMSQSWTPLGKHNHAIQHQRFVFTNSNSWKPLGKRNDLTQTPLSGLNLLRYS